MNIFYGGQNKASSDGKVGQFECYITQRAISKLVYISIEHRCMLTEAWGQMTIGNKGSEGKLPNERHCQYHHTHKQLLSMYTNTCIPLYISIPIQF